MWIRIRIRIRNTNDNNTENLPSIVLSNPGEAVASAEST
jgi:hypothetical protein